MGHVEFFLTVHNPFSARPEFGDARHQLVSDCP